MDWSKFIYGSYSKEQISGAVQDPEWQLLRVKMLGEDLPAKYQMLEAYAGEGLTEVKKVQITNYVNALKRGGLLK